MTDSSICSVENCGKPHIARGLCDKHYQQFRKSPDFRTIYAATSDIQDFLHSLKSVNTDACITWPYTRVPYGYGVFGVKKKTYFVHRFACWLRHGEPEKPGAWALHSCSRGHEGCCNPRHLYWADATQNARDRVNHGRQIKGIQVHTAKLTEDEVRQIKELFKQPRTNLSIAREFGVSESNIEFIRHGKTWKHI